MIARLVKMVRLFHLRRACFSIYRCRLAYLDACAVMAEMHAEGALLDEYLAEWEQARPGTLAQIEEWREEVLEKASRLGAVRAAWCWLEGNDPA